MKMSAIEKNAARIQRERQESRKRNFRDNLIAKVREDGVYHFTPREIDSIVNALRFLGESN